MPPKRRLSDDEGSSGQNSPKRRKETAQCKGITKAGRKCKNNVDIANGNGYCPVHQSQVPPPPPPPPPPTPPQPNPPSPPSPGLPASPQTPKTPTKTDNTSRYLVARVTSTKTVTFEGHDWTFRLNIDVSIDPFWTTRLSYTGEICLERVGFKTTNIGMIYAHRVSKPTSWQQHINRQWITDWLDVPLQGDDKIKALGESLAFVLQGLYNSQGEPVDDVEEQYKVELGNVGNDLVYVQQLQIENKVSVHWQQLV